MAIKTLYCHVLQSTISTVTDFEDNITRVICPEYDHPTRGCRLKQSASRGGPLSTFVARVAEDTLDQRTPGRCDYASHS